MGDMPAKIYAPPVAEKYKLRVSHMDTPYIRADLVEDLKGAAEEAHNALTLLIDFANRANSRGVGAFDAMPGYDAQERIAAALAKLK
ncbi:MAG: hypothetical protein AAF661_05080 [Pseudomonadota bacterium]